MKSVPATILAVAVVAATKAAQVSIAWSPNPVSNFLKSSTWRPTRSTLYLDEEQEENDVGRTILELRNYNTSNNNQVEIVQETRRRFLHAAAMNMWLFGGVAAATSTTAAAAADGGPTKYISGKPPQVPGAKPVDKSNVKGTRKDPDFLRSIADCRSQCQNSSSGPDGLAKSKEDCLSECQDICCKTYEQCTFNIVPRI